MREGFSGGEPTSSERRRHRAEEQGDVSLSHYQGSLHTHAGTPESRSGKTPEDVVETRRHSNCGSVPAEVLAAFYGSQMGHTYLGLTDHSRDASPEKGIAGVTDWFADMYAHNHAWLHERFGVSEADLSSSQREAIRALAGEQAKKLILYGDERLHSNITAVDAVNEQQNVPLRVLRGVEVNLMPDGTFDTSMVNKNAFELVNCSIHTEVDPAGYDAIKKDPGVYTDLLCKGIQHPQTNILCHPERDCPPDVLQELDWDRIAKEAIEHHVALEINLKNLLQFVHHDLMDATRFPKDSTSWQTALREKLSELVPLISSPVILRRLKPYIKQGLVLAINTDEHKNRFIDIPSDGEITFKPREFRFWRALKIVEEYCNTLFKELGIDKENLLNTYSIDELQKFLRKESA